MEPIIYKPGVYNTHGVYNIAGGIYNGRGVYNMGGDKAKLPPGCILLDYFKSGYRLGIKQKGGKIPTINYNDSEAHNLNYITHAEFGDSFPAARLDFPQTNDLWKLYYNLGNALLNKVNYTIEFLLRFDKDHPNVKWGINLIVGSEKKYYVAVYFPSNNSNTECGFSYTDTSDVRQWSGFQYISSYPVFSGEPNIYPTSWRHIALVNKNGWLHIYVNGKTLNSTPNIMYPQYTNKITLAPYAFNANDATMTKLCYYDIAQLAVWDYEKYTGNFTVPNKLIIDPDYT